MAAIAQGVLSVGQAGYGAYQARQGQKQSAALDDQFTGTAAERAAMLNSARDQSLMNRALDEANRSLATGVQALQGMGARGAGAVSGLVRSAGDTTASIAARQKAMEDQARQQLIQGNAMDSAYRRQMQMQQMQNAQQAQMAGMQNIANAAMSAASGFVDLASQGEGSKTKPGSETVTVDEKIKFDRNDTRARNQTAANIGDLMDEKANLMGENTFTPISRRATVEAGPVAPPTIVPDYEGIYPTTGSAKSMYNPGMQYPTGIGTDVPYYSPPIYTGVIPESTDRALKAMGKMPMYNSYNFERGGSATKTPGAFSHKTNPIHMVRQGTKIGEMTGGEYIFNPSQAASLRKHAKGGNTDLHKYVRRLLSKPQFK